MNRYRKNVFRTAWRNRGSVFGAMLIIAIGIFVFVSMIDTLRNLQDRILDYYKEAQLAEAFASVQGIGTDELSALSDLDGIRAAEGKLSGDIRMLADGQEEMFEKMLAFNRSVGLPTRLADIGITQDDLEKVLPQVLSMPDIAHNPYPVTLEMLSGAFRKLQDKNPN